MGGPIKTVDKINKQSFGAVQSQRQLSVSSRNLNKANANKSKMMRSMDKVFLVIVVLCCANQALCQTSAAASSSTAENASDVTEGQWRFRKSAVLPREIPTSVNFVLFAFFRKPEHLDIIYWSDLPLPSFQRRLWSVWLWHYWQLWRLYRSMVLESG